MNELCSQYKPGDIVKVSFNGAEVDVVINSIAKAKMGTGRSSGGMCAVKLAASQTGEKYAKSAFARRVNSGRPPQTGVRGAGEQQLACTCGICDKLLFIKTQVKVE